MSPGSSQPWLQLPPALWGQALETIGLEQDFIDGQRGREPFQHRRRWCRNSCGCCKVLNFLFLAFSESWLVFISTTIRILHHLDCCHA